MDKGVWVLKTGPLSWTSYVCSLPNKMIINPDKFKSIILTNIKLDDIPTEFSIGTDIVSIEELQKILGILLDGCLNVQSSR